MIVLPLEDQQEEVEDIMDEVEEETMLPLEVGVLPTPVEW